MKTIVYLACLAYLANVATGSFNLRAKLAEKRHKAGQLMAQFGAKSRAAVTHNLDDLKNKTLGFVEKIGNDTNDVCHLYNMTAQCCLPEVFGGKLCLMGTANLTEFSVTTALQFNNKTLLNNTYSHKDPKPICIPIPDTPGVQFCNEPYDLHIPEKNSFHFCNAVSVITAKLRVARMNFNCLTMKLSGDIERLNSTYTPKGRSALINADIKPHTKRVEISFDSSAVISSLKLF